VVIRLERLPLALMQEASEHQDEMRREFSLIQQSSSDDETIDLEYQIPPEARTACITLGELLDEAEEFCKRGEHLLTLTTPAEPLALALILGEFVAQIDGADPTPWDEWEHR
jgi:hypothetical protein